MSDFVNFYGEQFTSRLLIGTALYPSPATMTEAIKSSEAEIVTVGLRRQSPENAGGQHFWQLLKDLNKKLLPNTAGCESAKEAITLALMARDLFDTPWIKLEVIGDNYNLQPDPFETVIAAEALIKEGFSVFPYCTDDLVFCQKLVDVGCQVLMPWAAPIGTGKGLINPYALEAIRHRFSDTTLVVDAGIGLPSHALEAMQIGYDAILLNTAVAKANDPAMMAEAFRYAVHSGRLGYLAGPMSEQQTAQPSTPVVGKPFWHR